MQARTDWEYWKQSGNTAIIKKITALLKDMTEHPYTGIGKPEPLRGNLSGLWSRRIDETNRIVYFEQEEVVYIISCLGHYDD